MHFKYMISLSLLIVSETRERERGGERCRPALKYRITSFLIFIFIMLYVCILTRNKYYLKSRLSAPVTGFAVSIHIWCIQFEGKLSSFVSSELKFDQFFVWQFESYCYYYTIHAYIYLSIYDERVCNVLASLIMSFCNKIKKRRKNYNAKQAQTNC